MLLVAAVVLAGCGGAAGTGARATTSPGHTSSSSSSTPGATVTRPAPSGQRSSAVPSGLWVSDVNANVVTDFHSPPASTPATTFHTPVAHPDALAFDAQGNLWVGCGGSPPASPAAILEYGAGGLARGSGPIATISNARDGFMVPEGLAFDGHGNLWVAGGTAVVELAAGSLGHNAPAAKVLTSPLVDGPASLAFDGHGNLWVANYDNRVLLEHTARALAAPRPQPGAHVQLPSGLTPVAMAFDASGQLWIAAKNDMVYEYSPSASGMTASPVPPIDMGKFISGGAADLAFDANGDLWVSAVGSSSSGAPEGMVYEYAARTLGTTDTPSAALVASTSSNPGTSALAFYPVVESLGHL